MEKLELYKVSEEYINFLREVDSVNVKFNKDERRPYVGVVFRIGSIKYFAPLSSPKEKYVHMKNNLDFIKIKNGEQRAINLNNMIPVLDCALTKIDVEKEDKEYKNLLYDQIRFINNNADKIRKNAEKLYISVTKYHGYLEKRCTKFKELESKSLSYKRGSS